MDFRYARWDERMVQNLTFFKNLLSLYHRLLLMTDGNVEEALRALEELGDRFGFFNEKFSLDDFKKRLKDEDAIQEVDGRPVLTRKGERMIRKDSLDRVFGSLVKDSAGEHRVPRTGQGGERITETRPYAFGDSVSDIDFLSSVRNSMRRQRGTWGEEGMNLSEDDLEVFESEHLSSCATVLLIDVSHSMILYGEDRITPAKQAALALAELITTRYPKDSLSVVLFGDDAWEVKLKDLPYVSVGPFHTNTKAGLQLAQQILARQKHVNKQVFMITDGKPSAIFENGRFYKNAFGLDPKIVNKTLDEAVQCRRKRIPITTFMVTQDPYLVRFVERFTQLNKGRAYFSDLENLGSYLFVDFAQNRRRRVQ
ncbi:MAG TPA: VWA domain-containing protein [Candidatus Eisenbacteria bacterium]|nr:VWA domain-containing protein [Candidatus Eisenbacteria bacterium]